MDNMEDDKMNDDEKLYLQFLQNNISRMNSNSAQAKGWCIAIVTALLAIFSETKNNLFLFICFVPIILFCILDVLYLQQEHKFIGMYNSYVLEKKDKPKIFEMPMNRFSSGFLGFVKAFKSWSVILVYIPLLIVLIILVIGYPKEKKEHITFEEVFSSEVINDTKQNEVYIINANNEEIITNE